MIDLKDIFGKVGGEVAEQVLHALMVGAPAFLAGNFLPIDDPWQAAVTLSVGMGLGLGREYLQNVGDPPDEETWLTLWRVPINSNLLLDLLGYGVGTGLAVGLVLGL